MRVAALLPLLLSGGCYIVRQAVGQAGILLSQRDIRGMLADPDVPHATKEKLRLVRDIKEFGERVMGLTPSPNYESYYDTEGRPITWIVSACPRDSFRPYTWWFPIVGDVPYKGFFKREDAIDEARGLAAEGYDVAVGPAAAYSTLGYFADPVLSTMLGQPEEDLSSLLLHELTHGTVYVPGATDFNEGLASFVGWQGALEFARWRRGSDSPEYARAVRAYALEELRDALALELFAKLDELYRSGTPRSQVRELREEVARGMAEILRRDARRIREDLERSAAAGETDLDESRARLEAAERLLSIAARPVNNAEILMQRRYGGYDRFRAAFEKVGGDWRRFFDEFRVPVASGGSAPSPP